MKLIILLSIVLISIVLGLPPKSEHLPLIPGNTYYNQWAQLTIPKDHFSPEKVYLFQDEAQLKKYIESVRTSDDPARTIEVILSQEIQKYYDRRL